MSIFDDIESGFQELGNAVTGVANTVADNVSSTAVSFSESVANYAIIVGDGIASAGTTIGNGVVTFGNDVGQFSVSAGGTAFNWLKTSAYDVEHWVEDGVGIIANFTVDAFEKARDGLIIAWNFLKNLFTGHLDELDAPNDTARQIGYFLLAVAALGYEEMAKKAGMTIGFAIEANANFKIFGKGSSVGIYVDKEGQWGFMKLPGWGDFSALPSASISLDSGISLSITNTFVFGSRSTYSGKGYFKLGAEAKFGAFSAGGAVLLDSGSFDFLGFLLSASIGLDLAPNASDNKKPPTTTFSLTGQPLNVDALVDGVGGAGSVYDAAVSAVKNPGSQDRIKSTALAATMLPFTARFYGALRSLMYGGSWYAIPGAPVLSSGPSMSGGSNTFRFVSGLADPKGVSVQVIHSDGHPYYVMLGDSGSIQVRERTAEDSSFDAAATFNLEQGLADKSGVSFSTRTSTKQYLRFVPGNPAAWITDPVLFVAASDGSDTFARQATFLLAPQPQPPQETAVLRPGETLRVGDYRRSPDGRYFMVLKNDGALYLGQGPSPSFPSPPRPSGSPGTGWIFGVGRTDPSYFVKVPVAVNTPPHLYSGTESAPVVEKYLDLVGQPGAMFLAVTNGGRIVTIQGSPESPGEILHTSHAGTAYWAKSRKSIALRANNGLFVRWEPAIGAAVEMGYLFADSNKLSSYETFELLEHFDGTYSLRSAGGYYVNCDIYLLVNQEFPNTSTRFVMDTVGSQIQMRSVVGNKLWAVPTSGHMDLADKIQTGGSSFVFTMIPVERNLAAEVGRAFAIKNKRSGRYLTVSNGSQVENTAIIQLSETGGRNQSFTLIARSPGVYSFAAQHSGQVFDYGSTALNTPLLQHTNTNGLGQSYHLLPNADDTYQIIAKLTGLALAVSGGSTVDNAALVFVTSDASSDAQRFYLNPQQTLVTRALIADPTGGQAPMRVRYQERAGQSTWLDGWLDAIDRRLVGDFLGLGHAQILCLNRSGQGGRAMIADFSATNDVGTGRALYYEPNGENAWLNGWTDDNDWQLAGDFKALGRSQLMLINRSGTGGRVQILELSPQGYRQHYIEDWGTSALFNGWQDDTDRWLVGDFMGRGYDQVLCINRGGTGGKLMIVDFSGTTPAVRYIESWGQYAWLDASKFLTDSMRHFAGDFMGLGYAQLLVIDPVSRATKVCDFKTGTPVIRVDCIGPDFSGWLDDGDAQVVGDFMGRGRAQLLCTNRQPQSNGKVIIYDLATQPFPILYLEPWSQRSCFDGLLEPLDLVFAADFMGDGRKQAQILVLSPNIKSNPHPALIPQSGASVMSEGLSLRVRFIGGTEQSVPAGAGAYNAGTGIEGFTLELSPPIDGISVEYMASVIGQGNTAWVPAGTYCGSSVAGRAIQGFAVRLTGTYQGQYTIAYGANGLQASTGAYVGNTTNTPLTSLRIGSLRMPRIVMQTAVTTVGQYVQSPPQMVATVTTQYVLPGQGIVLATAQGGAWADTFAVSSRQYGGTSFRVNIRRRDNITVGWGQNLQLGWLACTGVNQPHFKSGTATIGSLPSGGNLKVVTIPFATPFAQVPKVLAMARGLEYVDVFAVTVRAVSTTGFTVNVFRDDLQAGWGQNLLLDFLAWDQEDGLRILGARQIVSGIAAIDAQANSNYKRVPVGFNSINPFATTPAVLLTPLSENRDEVFDATATEVIGSSFTANLARTDAQQGWTQSLRVTYLALR